MEHKENTILNRLDEPLRLSGIYKDEAATLLFPMLGGFFLGWVLSGMVVGGGSLVALRAFKKKNQGVALSHAAYWHLPSSSRALALPVPSYIREYVA